MTEQILSALKIFFAIAGAAGSGFAGYSFAKWREANRKRKEAEAFTDAMTDSQEKQSKREREHEERLSKIADGGVDPNDVGFMLSSYPPENKPSFKARLIEGRKRPLPPPK